ncbi:MAG: extracellular solute-binding protein [Solirubrobacterales bacterium]
MPSRRKLMIPLFALIAGAAFAVGCGGSSESDSADEADSEITAYSGRSEELLNPAIDIYESNGNGDIEVRFGDSAPLAATIVEEGENSPADVFIAQDAGSLGALEEEGLLAELPQDVLDMVEPRFRSDDGRWVGLTGRARVIAYGEDVTEEELPSSPLELTEPQWEGRVGWAPQNASLQAYVTALRAAQGDDVARDWLEGMVENGAREFPSNTPIRDAIAAGEVDVGLLNHYYVAQAAAEEGEDYPVSVSFPEGGQGSLINVAGIGILESADDPEQALELVRFLLGAEAQSYFAESSLEYPLASGVAADAALAPLAEIPDPMVDLSDIADLRGTLELMRETGAL